MNSYYLINLLIYAAVDAMACLGLSQQFGVAGVTNFGFIIFQAAGGYTAAILALAVGLGQRRDSSPTSEAGTCRSPSRGSARRSSAGLSRCRSRSSSGVGSAATSPPWACWSPRCC